MQAHPAILGVPWSGVWASCSFFGSSDFVTVMRCTCTSKFWCFEFFHFAERLQTTVSVLCNFHRILNCSHDFHCARVSTFQPACTSAVLPAGAVLLQPLSPIYTIKMSLRHATAVPDLYNHVPSPVQLVENTHDEPTRHLATGVSPVAMHLMSQCI